MHEIQEMMDKMIQSSKKEDMDYLGDKFVFMAHELKKSNPEMYKILKYKMRMVANDGHLTSKQAQYWVDSMENKDGTKGGHWTYEQTEDVRKQYAPEMDSCDWYAVLNSIYSDYYKPNLETARYIELAKDFLDDKDGKKGKALTYYTFVYKGI